MDNNDFNFSFNTPNFAVDSQTYINKFEDLLEENEKYQEEMNNQISNSSDVLCNLYAKYQLILAEQQHEVIANTIDVMKYNS